MKIENSLNVLVPDQNKIVTSQEDIKQNLLNEAVLDTQVDKVSEDTNSNLDSNEQSSLDEESSQESKSENNHTKKSVKEKAKQLQKKIKIVNKQKKSKTKRKISLLDLKNEQLKKEIENFYLSKQNRFLTLFYYFLSLFTFGFINLLNKWTKQMIYEKLIYKKVEKLENATTIVIVDTSKEKVFVPIQRKNLFFNQKLEFDTYVFDFNYQTYFWNEGAGFFQQLQDLHNSSKLNEFLKQSEKGISDSDAKQMLKTFGRNLLLLHKTPIQTKILDMISKPLVCFEIISLVVLYYLEFNFYLLTLLTYLMICFFNYIQKKIKYEVQLQQKYLYQEKLMVIRRNHQNVFKKTIVDSSQLVPGDLIEITNNLLLPADIVLTYGNCVIEDSSGHSSTKIPVEKNLETSLNNLETQNILHSGSKVLFTLSHINEGCFGVVLNTGFYTVRGETVRSLVIKKSSKFLYMKDAILFYIIMSSVAVCFSICYLLYEKFYFGLGHVVMRESLIKIFQVFIVLLKPAVPIAIFATTDCSTRKLKKKKISVNNKNKLFDLGKSSKFILDRKLLTTINYQNPAFLVSNHNDSDYKSFYKIITNPKKLLKSLKKKPIIKKYIESFALCNLITKVGDNYYGCEENIEMLQQSGFVLKYLYQDKSKIKRYFTTTDELPDTFSSEYQATRFFPNKTDSKDYQSVIIQNFENEYFLYTKGEPLDVQNICRKSSLPYNYSQTVSKYSTKGYKCVSLAFKKLNKDEINLKREELEQEMTFAGFYLNKLKVEKNIQTEIQHLKNVNIDLVVFSNSQLHLALSSAKKAGILDTNKPVYIGRIKKQNNVDTLHWEKISFEENNNNSLLKDANEDYDVTEDNFIEEQDCQLALTGKAILYLLNNSSEESQKEIINKCKIVGNLRKKEIGEIIEHFKTYKKDGFPLSYVHNGFGDLTIINQVDVTISLSNTQYAQQSDFYSEDNNLENLSTLVQESRTTISNKHKNFEFVTYFSVLQFVGLILLFSKYTSYAASHLFFMDFIVMLLICYMQSNSVFSEIKTKVQSRSIFNKTFLSRVTILSGYGAMMMVAIASLLWKTKFYQSPLQLSKQTHSFSPDLNQFYDPFVIFIFFVILNVRFIILNNTQIFKRNFLKNLDLLLAIVVLLVFSFTLLFIKEFKNPKFIEIVRSIFRIPVLHGFEYLIFMFAFVVMIGFFVVIYIEQHFFRKWISQEVDNFKEKALELTDKKQLSENLVNDASSDEKVDRRSKNTSSRHSRNESRKRSHYSSRRSKKEDRAERSCKLNSSRLEKKSRPKKKKSKKNK